MKVLVKIDGDTLSFQNKKRLNTEYKNMLNTNVISNDELVFSDLYITQNYKILTSFINEIIKTYNLHKTSFQNNEVFNLFIPIIGKLKDIDSIYMESDEVLEYHDCEILCKTNNIKNISFEYIPQYMFEMLDKYGIISQSRSEVLFTSGFMSLNELKTYSDMYYKYTVYLDIPLKSEDINDFASFLKINKYLKNVHINTPSKKSLEQVVYLLKEARKKNIKVYIHGDVHDEDTVNYLRKNNKIIKKKYKISLALSYSQRYIEDNLAKEANNTILRASGILMLLIALFSIVYVLFDNYRSMLEVSEIQEQIQEVIIATDVTEEVKDIENQYDVTIKNDYLVSLKSINEDVVAWVKVNNTNIDYPVVQTTNNDYYLSHNINKEKDLEGWVFMDYENYTSKIDDNIVLYAHNRYGNGVMFGTLRKTLNHNWHTDSDNQIITLDTLFGSYKYKIFSIYIVQTTSDYIVTNFTNVNDKLKFLNTIQKRSIYDFGVNLNENSKVLTLSTCQNSTSRLVVHAVLVEE